MILIRVDAISTIVLKKRYGGYRSDFALFPRRAWDRKKTPNI